jgi:hypothetical protein
MTSQWWRTLVIIAAVTLGAEGETFACSCATRPACQATWTADAVFTGTVVSIEQLDRDSSGEPLQSTRVTFNVDRGFVNSMAGRSEVLTESFSTCSYSFKAGGKYLVYASKTGASGLSTTICSRTRPIAGAEEDLRYLSTIGMPGTGGRVFGRINEFKRDPAEATEVDFGPVENIPVNIRGATLFRDFVTGADGRFQVSNLPIGKATVTVVLPPGFEPSSFEQEIELTDPRACAEVSLQIRQIARVSGTVVDASGRPLAGVSVDAVAAELAGFDPPPYQYPARTDERGAFEFSSLPPGVYVFGVNLTKEPYARPRGKSVFLPGTAVAKEATMIELKAGDNKEVGVLRLVDAAGGRSPQ